MKFDNLYESILKGLSQGMDLEDIAKKHNVDIKHLEQQLEMGIEVEKEHDDDMTIRKTIAMDHLVEDPDYYTKLKAIHKD
jgi:hypothetical protein